VQQALPELSASPSARPLRPPGAYRVTLVARSTDGLAGLAVDATPIWRQPIDCGWFTQRR
jgi:hypothetical protein